MNFLTFIPSIVKDSISFFTEKRKAKHEMAMAGINNRTRLLSDEQTYNHEWEMQALEDKDKVIRRISFVAFILPFVVAIFSPSAVQEYFEVALASIPEWWQNAYIGITGSVWGISTMKNVFGQALGTAASKLKK